MAVAGKNAGLYIGSTPTKIAETTEANLSVNGTTIDTTNFDSNEWGEFINGTKSWSINVTANFKANDTNGQIAAINNIFLSEQTAIPVELRLTSAASPKFAGNAIVSNVSVSTPVNDKVTLSFTLTGSGALAFTAA
jgi:predicted secreted protein